MHGIFYVTLKTTIAQLEEVQAAITKILEGGQDLGRGDKRLIRARLASLSEREQVLLTRYYAEQGEGVGARNVGLIRRD